ncbi:182 kDa tankyrase-1-binding protein [Gracilinanus agilis]|uniref:182 kDa tankyrase-1-binding protein n=1 Tax=Gracilinanus agilis TaxID=191870 RepID=UPI001CFCF60E|nr:182 kDa tankyrase-1-binding protein [Gracilinanus agilis]
MNLSTLRESALMASQPPQEMEEELLPAGLEPGDSRAKPPVKPKPEPRTLPAKPALPAKPSLLVPLGPRPPRGPLAELPSARKMNMLAGPQPYGGSKRPLAFSPRPAPEAPSAGASPREASKEEGPPTTPPARCPAPAGVRKAPAPFRPLSDRFSTSTVEEILAKMEQPRKEGPSSPDRLWGSRLTFSHDGSSHYGPRVYGPVQGPGDEEVSQSTSKALSQEEQAQPEEGQDEGGRNSVGQCPAQPQDAQPEASSRISEERRVSSDPTSNGDLAPAGDLASAALLCAVSKPSAHPHHTLSPVSGCSEPHDHPPSPAKAPVSLCPAPSAEELSTSRSPAPSTEKLPESLKPFSPSFPSGESSGSPSSVPSPEKTSTTTEAPGSPGPEHLQVISPQIPPSGGQFLELSRTFPLEEKAEEGGELGLRAPHLEQRRFSEGVLRPPSQDQRKLGGSLAALPQGQGGANGLEQPFGSGTESNWSLSQSFEWTFPTRPSGLGVWRLDSPPPSPITEADDSGLSEGEGEEADGVRSSRPIRAASGIQSQSTHQGLLQNQQGDDRNPASSNPSSDLQPKDQDSPRLPLLQAEEVAGPGEPLAGLEVPFPPTPEEEAALPILEPVREQEPPLPPAQPCILFADAPVPEQATPSQEDAPDLAKAETNLTRPEGEDPPRMSPELRAPESDSGWLDKLLASPPPSANGVRKATVPEQREPQMPSASPEGLLGWAQKDLKSEFGIGVDSHPSTFSSSSAWARESARGYGIGGAGPRERDWGMEDGRARVTQSQQEWSNTYGISQPGMEDEFGSRSGDQSKEHILGGDRMAQEFGKADQLGPYSCQAADLQDREFEKRDSLGTFSSQAVELQDWEFGKKDPLGTFSSQDADLHGRHFEKRTWMSEYGGGSQRDADRLERAFGERDLSGVFSVEHSEQQDKEFGKKDQSDSSCLREVNREEMLEKEPEILYGPNAPNSQDQALGEGDLSSWPKSNDSNRQGEFGKKEQAETYRSNDANRPSREFGKKDWPSEFGQGDTSQTEREFSLGRRDWTSDFRIEGTDKSDQFGIIGTDRGNCSGLGILSGSNMGSTNFVSPGNIMMGQTQWTDDLGLRNLDVSGCVGSEGPSEAREHGVGQTDWSSDLGLRNMNMSSGLGNGDPGESRELGVGQKDWTPDLGLRNIDVSRVLESTGPSEARECGVGQTNWIHSLGIRNTDAPSDAKPGDPLSSREHGVGQADWTSDLMLRNLDLGTGGSLREAREHGVGQMGWSHDLGLRNMNLSSPLESGGSSEARECGVGQMDWQDNLGLRATDFSGSLDLTGTSEAREHGVGQVAWPRDGDLTSPSLSGDLEAGEPSEARELGVGEVSQPGVPESQYGGNSSQPSDGSVAETGMDSAESTNSGTSSGGYLGRSPPSGSQGPPQDVPGGSGLRVAAGRERTALSPGAQSEEEEEEETMADGAGERGPELGGTPLPSCRPQPDGEASRAEEMDGGWAPRRDGPAAPRLLPGPPSEDFSFMEDTEVLDSAMYRSRANLGRKRGHRAPAIRPGGTLGLSEADSDAWLFQDSTEPRASRVPSSDEEVVEEPQSRRTRMSLGTKGLKVNLFPGLSPSALKAKLRPRNRSAEEGEPVESKSAPKESAVQRSKSCKVPGLGKPLALPPKPEKSSGSEGSSPTWLQALKLKKKRV